MWRPELPTLGVGLGFREPLKADLFTQPDAVDFLEITADHFFDATRAKRQDLEILARHFTLIPHGLDLSLGSAEGIDADYLAKFAELVERLDPPWCSEHIAFTRAGGVRIGHLAPLPLSREAIDVVTRNVAAVQRVIRTPLILENITRTVSMPGGEMDEADFLRRLFDRIDCGLLLDVTNLYTNAVNLRFDGVALLRRLPLERIVQLHFTGGHWHDGELVDSHAAATPEAVWALLDETLRLAPVRGMILERDEDIPPLAELRPELQRARGLGRRHGRWGMPAEAASGAGA